MANNKKTETTMAQVSNRKKVFSLLLIMAAVSMVVGGTALFLPYRTTFEQQRSRLVEMVQSQARLLQEVAGMFIEMGPGMLEDIKAALAAGDAQHLEKTAHTLKGTASNFAAYSVVQFARELEFIGREGSLTEAGDKLAALEGEFQEALQALSRPKDNPPA